MIDILLLKKRKLNALELRCGVFFLPKKMLPFHLNDEYFGKKATQQKKSTVRSYKPEIDENHLGNETRNRRSSVIVLLLLVLT